MYPAKNHDFKLSFKSIQPNHMLGDALCWYLSNDDKQVQRDSMFGKFLKYNFLGMQGHLNYIWLNKAVTGYMNDCRLKGNAAINRIQFEESRQQKTFDRSSK